MGIRPMGIHRHEEQHTGGFALVLHQRDGRSDGGLTGVDGTLCRGTAVRFRADVQALRAGVARGRLDKLDDVKIVVVPVRELADGETRRAVGPLGGNEGVQSGTHDALNEAKAPHAGKLCWQVARFDVGQKRIALHMFADGV